MIYECSGVCASKKYCFAVTTGGMKFLLSTRALQEDHHGQSQQALNFTPWDRSLLLSVQITSLQAAQVSVLLASLRGL